jgi:glycosyltransferase involved in cell wall biosynthesis
MATTSVRLGIVTSGSAGWKTVRQRWERDLSDYDPRHFHIEDYCTALCGFTERFGAKSIGHSLAGRAAVRAALDAGANVILMSTLQNAPLIPTKSKVAYLIYGDCTTSQLTQLYGGKPLGFPGSWITSQLNCVAKNPSYFLCMSKWYGDALQAEFEIPAERIVILPFYVDTAKWKPGAKRDTESFNVLFIGGDLARKGGDIVYAMAAMEDFKNVNFHIVSPNAVQGGDNVHAYRGMTADSDDLIRLVQTCDVMVLPTSADISPNVALEASACELPVITTRCGGIPELVLDQVTGSIVPSADLSLFAEELVKYRDDATLVASRGKNARLHVEKYFSKTRHIDTLRNVIETAAEHARAL